MSEKKIVVPEGMYKAVERAAVATEEFRGNNLRICLTAALRWLAENPIVPTAEQLYSTIGKLPVAMCDIVWTERDRAMIAEWQSRMFLAPERDVCKCCGECTAILRGEEEMREHKKRWHNHAPEPKVPEDIAGMQGIHLPSVKDQDHLDQLVTALNVEAYRRGKNSK